PICRGACASDGSAADTGTGSCARASMRPRRVRLGWSISKCRRPSTTTGFNEAEARAPRMDPGAEELMLTNRTLQSGRGACASDGAVQAAFDEAEDLRFNEAEARAPRMAGGAIRVDTRLGGLQ